VIFTILLGHRIPNPDAGSKLAASTFFKPLIFSGFFVDG